MIILATAWLLLATFDRGATITVPGIASEIECEKLAMRVSPSVEKVTPHRCIDYQMVIGSPRQDIHVDLSAMAAQRD